MDVTTRLAQPADHAAWLRMRKTLWPDTPEAVHRREMAAIRQDFDTQPVFVALAGGEPVGFLELSIRVRFDAPDEPAGYVEGWFVEPAARGRGIGRRLMEAAERWTAAHGLGYLASDASLDNEGGIRAHHALGFEETERVVLFLKPVARP